MAEKHGKTPAQILICWALARETVVIPKSADQTRLRENFQAGEILLDGEDLVKIAGLDMGYRYVDGSFWEVPGSGYTAAELWDE